MTEIPKNSGLHKMHIQFGASPKQCQIEMDGQPMKGVSRVEFALDANSNQFLKLEIYGEVTVDGEFVDQLVHSSVPPPQEHMTVKTEGSWQWWAGADEEWCTVGPEDSREAIIQAATNDCLGEFQDGEGRWKLSFHIVEARQDPLRLADWIEADELLNRAEDGVGDSDRVTSEYDDGPYFEGTPAQTKDFRERIERACDEWQAAHGLVFTCRTFSHTRENEQVVVDHPTPAVNSEGQP